MKKFFQIFLSMLLFAGCTGCNSPQVNPPQSEAIPSDAPQFAPDPQLDNTPPNETYRQISMEEAVSMMAQEHGYIILDVRRPDEFVAGHIPNAINVANETIGAIEIPELPDKNQLIMVYCRSGRRSKEASEKLVKLGYTNIVEFGGILDWKGEIVTEN